MSDVKSNTIDYYNRNAASFLADTLTVDMQALYDEFLPLLPNKGLILDLGCGSGRDSLAFVNHGFDVHAFDASAAMVKQARQLVPQAQISQADFGAYHTTERFDGLWACASLLHVPANELTQVFARCASWLNPKGVFYCSFKYGEQAVERNGRYFTDLTETGLEHYLQGTGLAVKKLWLTGDKRPGRAHEQWLNALLVKAVSP